MLSFRLLILLLAAKLSFEPGMLKCLLACVSLSRSYFNQFKYKVFALVRDCFKFPRIEAYFSLSDFVEDSIVIITIKRTET